MYIFTLGNGGLVLIYLGKNITQNVLDMVGSIETGSMCKFLALLDEKGLATSWFSFYR